MFPGNRKRNQERANKLAKLLNGSVGEQFLSIGTFRNSTHYVKGVSQSVKYDIHIFHGGLWLLFGGFHFPSGIVISLNKTWSSMMVRESIKDLFPEYGMPIYKPNLSIVDIESIKRFLGDSFTLSTVQELQITRKESLYIASQHISLFHRSREDEFFKKRFNAILQLIMHHAVEKPLVGSDGMTSRYAESHGVKIDPQKIPDKLRVLIPLARRWAIGDDVERSNYLKVVSIEDKKLFIEKVKPLFNVIEEYCNKNRNQVPIPDEVVLFNMMSETYTEVSSEAE